MMREILNTKLEIKHPSGTPEWQATADALCLFCCLPRSN